MNSKTNVPAVSGLTKERVLELGEKNAYDVIEDGGKPVYMFGPATLVEFAQAVERHVLSQRAADGTSGLTRYGLIGSLMNPMSHGAYYRVEDVQALLATKAAQPAVHASDCAMHNEPAMPNGPCDCGARPAAGQVPEDRKALRDEALSAARELGDCEHEHARNLGKGGPGVEEKVRRAEARVVAAINALAAVPVPPVPQKD
ncbi:hypothetical protein NX774_12025 [Massilia agilis]|uniref:Uncharacterized protein n=1 Tax=Massilia agilis TaxID=1811226 RepID=A0ABT2DBE1_9BURK|nr:hypothetical protein [Massilia agilis]MCS0808647.1 hypothetical protein [Massilia agilis]